MGSKEVVIYLPEDTAEQIRKFLENEIDRIERLAREAVAWWREERKKQERVNLLKEYLICFPKGDDGNYRVIFYR